MRSANSGSLLISSTFLDHLSLAPLGSFDSSMLINSRVLRSFCVNIPCFHLSNDLTFQPKIQKPSVTFSMSMLDLWLLFYLLLICCYFWLVPGPYLGQITSRKQVGAQNRKRPNRNIKFSKSRLNW